MSRPHRLIKAGEVQRVVFEGELIEDYPDYLAITTAYVPDSSQWSADFRRRVT